VHRTSDRLAANAPKRPYAGMQGASGASRKKRTKCASHTSVENDFAAGKSVPIDSGIRDLAVNERAVDSYFRVGHSSDDLACAIDGYPFCADELPCPLTAHVEAAYVTLDDENDAQSSGSDMDTMSHDDGMAVLDGYFRSDPLVAESLELSSLDTLLGLDDNPVPPILSPPVTQLHEPGFVQVLDQSTDSRVASSACLGTTTSLVPLEASSKASDPRISSQSVPILTRQVKRVGGRVKGSREGR
jgi:hypothetical protein